MEDIFFYIATTHLHIKEILKCSILCRTFNNVAKKEILWKTKFDSLGIIKTVMGNTNIIIETFEIALSQRQTYFDKIKFYYQIDNFSKKYFPTYERPEIVYMKNYVCCFKQTYRKSEYFDLKILKNLKRIIVFIPRYEDKITYLNKNFSHIAHTYGEISHFGILELTIYL